MTTGKRATEFAIKGLQYVFTPPGLPLVEKSTNVPPTTSILVRGAAGTGKSTLAMAIAHGIARELNGIVLYLVTEASLSDPAYKAASLKLSSLVVPFDPALQYESGTIAVSHLVLLRPEAINASTKTLRANALDVTFELLSAREGSQNTPIRAVVIDGFGLLQNSQANGAGRSDLIAFLQAVEDFGISPILIEEVGGTSSDLLTFPVDVALTLTFARDPDTGRLVRHLVVSKSRYSDSTPGPHDAVLDNGVPTLWPMTPSLDFGPVRIPVAFFMPMPSENRSSTRVLSINRGALILSRYDSDRQTVVKSFARIPGLVSVQIHCGPTTRLVEPGGQGRLIPASSGPAALLWLIHEAMVSGRVNGVHFSRMEYFLDSQRFAAFIPDLVDRLKERGILVIVHGETAGLHALDRLADFTGPTGHYMSGDIKVPKLRNFRIQSAWGEMLLPGVERPPLRPGIAFPRVAVAALRNAEEKLTGGDLVGARDVIINSLPPTNDPLSLRYRIEAALLLDRLGMPRTAVEHLRGLTSDDGLALAALGWALAELGDEQNACRVAMEAINNDEVEPAGLELWRSLWVRYTNTPFVVDANLGAADRLSPLHVRLLAQGLSARGALSIAESLLSVVPNSVQLRLRADLRLESPNVADWHEADALFQGLVAGTTTTVLERADILFNLGFLRERFSQRDAAIEFYRKSIDANPLHELAAERLAALRSI